MENDTMSTINISKAKIEEQKGVVVLPLKEYQKLLEQAVPTYYLKGKEARDLDRLVNRGLKEYESGKTIEADSLRSALRINGRRKNKKN